jgi:MFS family permease
MKKKLDKLPLENFLVLRQPLESGRQSPESLAGIFVISPFLIGVCLVIVNFFVFGSFRPSLAAIVLAHICNAVGIVLVILSIIFAFKKVFQKRERTQYFISIIIIQAIIGYFYVTALYILYEDPPFRYAAGESEMKVIVFIIATFIIGVILFISAFIRFYKLLEKGAFKKNTKRDQVRISLEARTDTFKVFGIVAGVSAFFIFSSLLVLFDFRFRDMETLFMITLFITLFYTMMFILPEQLVIWYCKGRFKCFNFDENNEIYPLSSDMDSREVH